MLKRIFSVMRKRDDLPEMTLPLAVLMIAVSALFSCGGAKLLSSSISLFESGASGLSLEPVRGIDVAGVIRSNEALAELCESVAAGCVALLLVPMAICLYSSVILLWRRVASLLVTPASAALALVFGVSLFSAVVYLTSVLVLSYVYATSVISGDKKFRRSASVVVTSALCAFLAFMAYAGFFSGSLSGFVCDLNGIIASAAEMFYASAGQGITETTAVSFAGSMVTSLPAMVMIGAVLVSILSDALVRCLFRLFDCGEYFTEISSSVVIPKSYAIIYATVFFTAISTSRVYNPLIYVMCKNVAYSMMLPCAAVGLTSLFRKGRDEYFYMTRKKAAILILAALVFMSLGLNVSLILLSLGGAAVVICTKRPSSPTKSSDLN